MKKKKITYRNLVDEIWKFKDLTEPASLIATTDPDCPDEGANYVDGSGVLGVHDRENEGILHIVCGDSGRLTWAQLGQKIVQVAGSRLDEPTNVKIGYGCGVKARNLVDFEGDPCRPRAVLDCGVLPEDTIWNLTLAP